MNTSRCEYYEIGFSWKECNVIALLDADNPEFENATEFGVIRYKDRRDKESTSRSPTPDLQAREL